MPQKMVLLLVLAEEVPVRIRLLVVVELGPRPLFEAPCDEREQADATNHEGEHARASTEEPAEEFADSIHVCSPSCATRPFPPTSIY